MNRTACLVAAAASLAAGVLAQVPSRGGTDYIRLLDDRTNAPPALPVELTIQQFSDMASGTGSLRVLVDDGRRPHPCPTQILDVRSGPPGGNSHAPQQRTFIRLAVQPPAGHSPTSDFRVAWTGGESPKRASPALRVTGSGVGRTVDTGRVVFELDSRSGQLRSFIPRMVNRDRVRFEQNPKDGMRPFHWNPDVWMPSAAWGHTCDWRAGIPAPPAALASDAEPEPPDGRQEFAYREQAGPLLYRLTRWGRVPYLPSRVDASVTYTFHAGSPAVLVSSVISFREGAQASAVRNSELVFSRGQFDTAFWITADETVHTATCYDHADSNHYYGVFAEAPRDTICLGFANEERGYGIAMVLLNASTAAPYGPYSPDEQSHFYFLDTNMHGRGSPKNFLYFVRVLAYREGYGPTYVPAGTVFSESSAILAFALGGGDADRFEEIRRWTAWLRRPPRIIAN